MVRRGYFAVFVLMILGVASAIRAQDVKDGICPTNGFSHYSLTGPGRGFLGASQVDPLAKPSFYAPEYSPALVSATSLGVGAVGAFPLFDNYFLRVSLLDLYPSLTPSFGVTSPYSRGILMPIEFGIRVPIVNSTLGTLGYTLYGETSAGLLLGWAFPINGSFLNYSVPYSRFTTGATAYAGIGNTLRLDRYVGLYLNGGMGYFDLFSSSFLPRTSYFVPSVAIGFYFNIAL